MEMLEIFGWFGALLIGLVLGLIGGGGSILTVPILVYLLAFDSVTATAYSLFVVGTSALIGAIRNAQKGMVDFKTGVVFAIPAFIAVYFARKFIVPAIPEELGTYWGFDLTKDKAILGFFAIVMLMAAISMIFVKRKDHGETKVSYNYPMIFIEGILVGVLTGVVGAGGGFLIIPALVLLAKLPMKKAVGTSLMIIAVKSLIGFIGDVETMDIDWGFLLSFTALSAGGIFIGIYLTNFIDGKKLKKGFGVFVLLAAVYILSRELNLF